MVEHLAIMQEVTGSSPDRIKTQDLKTTQEKVLPLYSNNDICKWLDFQVCSDKDYKP